MINLPVRHMILHRYKTTVMYVSLLTVIHICVMVFFGVRFISNQIATEPEKLFPYDYVCLANTDDGEFFDELQEECGADILTFPMVRVSAMDGTEAPNDFRPPIHPQGQHIGISESTYRELKALNGDMAEKNLGLDAKGKKVYIVYQQDQAAKAKPADWYIWTEKPYLHIGNPVLACNRYERKKIYPPRIVAGEETGSLIGALRQGKYEDIIVFSNEYFQQVQDAWKETSIITGRELTEAEAQEGWAIEESPTKLQLVNIQEQYRSKAEPILERFENQYEKEQKYDPLVRRVYDSKELAKQRGMEHRLEIFLNGFIIMMLSAVSLFLLHMKVKMELPEMKTRYLFMERLGMRQKERIKAEKKEIARFVYIPLMISAPIVTLFTAILFRLRMFSVTDMLNYGMYLLILIAGYVVIQFVNMKWLQHTVVKQVERDIAR